MTNGANIDLEGALGVPALSEIADRSMDGARSAGCAHAALRVERVRSQLVVLRDGELETSVDDTSTGMGLSVVRSGAFGFAATVDLSPDAAGTLAPRATEMAALTGAALAEPVELAPEPRHRPASWSSPYDVDPTSVARADKVALLAEWSHRLLDAPGVDHVSAYVLAVTEDKHYVDMAGTVTTQRRVRVHPVIEAVTVDDAAGRFESMRSIAPPVGRGWEYLNGEGWDWEAELEAIPELLAEKLAAPSVEPGPMDLVIDPSNLWLTIHESIGHATELDRALGYEAAYAGTSFATPDKLGSLRYGSPVMQVVGDRTTPHGLATIGYDDEGVESQSFDIVRDGVLVGYQLDRRMAAGRGVRSNGCAYADSPLHVPMQRMANVSLKAAPGDGPTTEELVAGVERGLYVVGDKSWSIDMQRYNFQFTGQRFYRIVGGRLAGQVRDVAYQAQTTEFWGALEAVGGTSTYVLGGAFNCGKGQPGQVAPVSHGCPAALFRGVRVLNARDESGAPG
jgi:TldD protein